jgi:hypothetical protein
LCFGFLADRLREFRGLVLPAQLDGFSQAIGELDARRTTGDVGCDFLTGLRRQFQVQVVREQGEDFLAFLIVLVLFHVSVLLLCESPSGRDAIWF